MPITPLHIGIPGLISYYFPKRVDIVSVILGCIILDIDFFLLLILKTPVHGFFHSIIGATICILILIIIIKIGNRPIIKIKKVFRWEPASNLTSITLGAFIGTFSHVFIDSLIYSEINLFYPINGNPLYIINGQEIIFFSVYVIAILSTIIFLILFIVKYNKRQN